MNNLNKLIHEYRKKAANDFNEIAFVSGVSALACWLADSPEAEWGSLCDAIMEDVGDFIAEKNGGSAMTKEELEAYDAMMVDRDRWRYRAEQAERGAREALAQLDDIRTVDLAELWLGPVPTAISKARVALRLSKMKPLPDHLRASGESAGRDTFRERKQRRHRSQRLESMKTPPKKPAGEVASAATCSACSESLELAMKAEGAYRQKRDALERMEQHLEQLVEKLAEVRREIADDGNDFRLVPLSHQDSGVTLAVCESIGVDLIPLTPWNGSLFLDQQQFSQLEEAMAEFRQPNAKVEAQSPANKS